MAAVGGLGHPIRRGDGPRGLSGGSVAGTFQSRLIVHGVTTISCSKQDVVGDRSEKGHVYPTGSDWAHPAAKAAWEACPSGPAREKQEAHHERVRERHQDRRLSALKADLPQRYEARTPGSKRLFEQLQRRITGGVEGSIKFSARIPWLLSRRRAPWLEAELAEMVAGLYPSIESLRFTNSGLEATLLAVRLGLAASGRDVVAKFEGHYHGGHEHVLVSVSADPDRPGPERRPSAVPAPLGLPEHFVEHTIVLPFNDYEACEAILTAERERVGVVVLEPMEAGVVPADPQFLRRLRELTERLGIVLVFDEVKTGFRVRLGGAQEYYGVQADLTALGKILGGGLPIGAVGGKREIMELLSPLRAGGHTVFHSGTFNGNPTSVAAGIATLQFLQEPGVFQGVLDATDALRCSVERLGQETGFPVQTVGVGAVFDIFLAQDPVTGYRTRVASDRESRLALDFCLIEEGVFSKPLNRYSLSTAHTAEVVRRTEDAFARSFACLRALKERGAL